MEFINKLRISFVVLILSFSVLNVPSVAMEDDGAQIEFVKTVRIAGFGERRIENLVEEIERLKQVDVRNAKGILGEIAAIALFKSQGYEILENQAKRFIGCELTSKRGKAGIDGIFLKDGGYSIFNEAKYRERGCRNTDLPDVSYGQEMSVKWVSYNFSHLRNQSMTKNPSCSRVNFRELERQYDQGDVMRTLTCLKGDGNIDLYYVDDENENVNNLAKRFLNRISDISLDYLMQTYAKEVNK